MSRLGSVSDSVLPLIPARGGSKGIPNKNMSLVAGVPLVVRAIKTAKQSSLSRDPIVSTDCPLVAESSKRAGAEVVLRPASLATDESGVVDTIQHHLKQYASCDFVCLLQPTNPLRTAEHIDKCLRAIQSPAIESVSTWYRVEDCHPSRMYWEDGEPVLDGTFRRRQDLMPAYHRSGNVYIASRSVVWQGTVISSNRHCWVEVPRREAFNVDDLVDLEICNALAKGIR